MEISPHGETELDVYASIYIHTYGPWGLSFSKCECISTLAG